MSILEAAQKYFDAWNSRSPQNILATIETGGTYEDPLTGGPLTGEAIGRYAGGLFDAFPDLSFELVSTAETGPNTVAAQWIMRGTNTGSMQGAPPTHKPVKLPGADFITVRGGKVETVKGYFDSAEVPRQLGMQVVVQPTAVGPVEFGTSVYMNLGKPTRPGAFSITSLRIRSEEEGETVSQYSQRILQELAASKGFISTVLGRAGSHMFTVTAWESPEDSRQMDGGAHREAVDAFFRKDFTLGGVTSLWTPLRINRLWVRCNECREMSMSEGPGSKCRSGHTLPAPPPYW
jgi:steroid delta-isomerase-like uncharacterized protein